MLQRSLVSQIPAVLTPVLPANIPWLGSPFSVLDFQDKEFRDVVKPSRAYTNTGVTLEPGPNGLRVGRFANAYLTFNFGLAEFSNIGEYTVIVWAKPSATNQAVFFYQEALGFSVFTEHTTSVRHFCGGTEYSVAGVIAAGNWYFLAFGWNKTTDRAFTYVNGSKTANAVATGAGPGAITRFRIGGNMEDPVARYFAGDMGFFAAYNKMLSDEDVLRMYEMQRQFFGK